MNLIKTATISILLLIVLSVIFYFLPIEEILTKLPYINTFYNNTSLTVNSKNGKALIKISGKDYGQTPATITDLEPGTYDIELTRVSDTPDFYQTENIRIELEKSAEAIVDFELGPKGISSGYVLYYTKVLSNSDNNGFLTLITTPSETSISLNDELLGKSPLKATKLNAKEYKLKIANTGYEDLEIPVIVRNGYNLNIKANLYPIPTTIK